MKNDDTSKKTELRKLENITLKKEDSKMVGTCPTNGSHRVGAEGIQEEAGMAKDKLDIHRETQPEEHEHHAGGSQGSGGRQDRMASTCGPVHPTECGMNRTEDGKT